MNPNYPLHENLLKADPPDTFDNTMLVMFGGCRRKLYWWLRGLRTKSRPAYFTFGSAWQAGLEAFYSKPDASFDERYQRMKSAAFKFWDNEAPIENGGDKRENLDMLIMWYALSYNKEPWTEVILNGEAMELGFRFPLGNTEYYLGGAMDGNLLWQPYGRCLLENKTTGLHLSETYMLQWSHSSQVTQYIWALAQLLEEWPFGAVMNVASKAVTKKAIAEFKKTHIVPDGYFTRQLEQRSPFDIKTFEEETRLVIEDIYREWERWEWPRTREAQLCSGGLGKSRCEYRRICLSQTPFYAIENPLHCDSDLTWATEEWKPWERGRSSSNGRGREGNTSATDSNSFASGPEVRVVQSDSGERTGTSRREIPVEVSPSRQDGNREVDTFHYPPRAKVLR